MKVFGWLADQSACGHYRIMWPFEAMRGIGVDAEVRESLSGQEMIDADVTIAQRTVLPGPVALLDLAVEHGAKVVFEIDDDLFHLDPANPLFSHFQQPLIRAGLQLALSRSAAVFVSTEPLADVMREYNDAVYVIPNCMPDYMVDLSREAAKVERAGGARILWAGSATHHGDFIKDAKYGLKRVLQRTDARFTCMGYDYRRQLGVDGEYVGWADDIPSFHRSLVGYDIGLCPLAKNTFNRSKSGIKAMEYQACGIVPVATDCEAYRDVIEHGVDGFLCRTPEDWKDALCTLASDHDLRLKMMMNGLQRTAERTYRENAWRWKVALRLV